MSSNFDINDFINYIKNKINNANLKIGINATWSHANGYSGEKFQQYYNSNPTTQYNAIQSVIPQVANHMSQCDFVINTGLAINMGRNNTYLNNIGDQMLRDDKNHLDYGISRFMAAFCYAAVICGIKVSDISWYPTSNDDVEIIVPTTAYLGYLAKQCAYTSSQFSQIDSSLV